ncbi:ABC-type bacteriocin/lantibiotic exporter [Francisella cf. novicida Fx1]|uniref:type I secretion system permease/ATPase n=1 Tax=Francisella tularensis TaxID=263 RepID=UPI0002059013|nr:type I secretion system permease/ATPase [Francisella tularensis]AEB27750.1 ABC-type bacteriocin/lantibiotic exporter [Francisella cf. novicida Fx1]
MHSGIFSLYQIAHFNKIAIDPKQIAHEYADADGSISEINFLRAIKANGFKAKSVSIKVDYLDSRTFPIILRDNDGEYFVLAAINQEKYLVIVQGQKDIQSLTKQEFSQIYSGKAILVTHKGVTEKTNESFNIKWFIPALWKYKHIFKDVIIASLFIQLFGLMTPFFFQVVMDKVIMHNGITTLNTLAIVFLVVAIFEVIFGMIRTYLFSHTTSRVDVVLGSKLFSHLMRLPLEYFEARQVGQNVARVKELDSIRNFITSTALTLLIDLSFTFIFIAVLFLYSWQLTLIVLGTIPIYFLLSVFITPILKHRLNKVFSTGAKNQSFLTESITGIQTIKANAIEPQMQRKWEDNLTEYVKASFRSQNLGNIAGQTAELINKLTTIAIIFIGAHMVMSGRLTIGQLIAFNMLAGRVTQPILKLVNIWQEFQQAGVSLKRLGDILNYPTESYNKVSKSNLPLFRGAVTFKDVKFRYSADTKLILNELNLEVQAGQTIGIVGRSGSGKSTLTKLIQRLYRPESGKVLVDGVDLSTVDTTWLRQNIGVVLQESFMFNRTVRENIALTNPSASMEQVVAAARFAGAEEFILDLKDGFDTVIEEGGSNFSGGQKQRLSIARALMNNPKILILDEATSALDYESEKIIQNNMAKISQGRTVFIIAHRLSTVQNCDRIIYMDQGKIIEDGSHQELLAKNGHYASLYNAQHRGEV